MIGVTKRLFPYFKRYRFTLIAGLASVVAGGALGSVIPWLLKRAIDVLNTGAPLREAFRVAGFMVLASFATGVFRFLMRELLNSLSRRIETDLRSDLFKHLLTLDAPYYGTTRTGELMARLTNDVSAVRMAAGPAIMYFVNTVVGGLFALGFMLRIDARL
ncbi:MAG: ABC transporter transmembrane domain-containing protein, partial [Gemmatimonadaceae bacterium]